MILTSMHVVTCVSGACFIAEQFSVVWGTATCLSILLLTDTRAVSSFWLLMNKTATNMRVAVFMWARAFINLWYMPNNEIAESRCRYF